MTNQGGEINAIAERVEKVERVNRLLTAIVLLGAITICLALWLASSTATVSAREPTGENTIEAQRFVLKDAQGNVRAVLENTDHGPGLTFLSTNGETHAQIEFTSDGLGISWGIKNKTRDLLLINKNFTVGLSDESSAPQMGLSLNSEDHRFDVAEIRRAGDLGLSLQGDTPTLSLSDSSSSVRAVLRADSFGGRLSLLGSDANSQVSLGVGPQGAPGLTMKAAQDNPNASIHLLPTRAVITLTDAQGKHLDLAP